MKVPAHSLLGVPLSSSIPWIEWGRTLLVAVSVVQGPIGKKLTVDPQEHVAEL